MWWSSYVIAADSTPISNCWWIHFSHERNNYNCGARIRKFPTAAEEFLWFRWKFFEMTAEKVGWNFICVLRCLSREINIQRIVTEGGWRMENNSEKYSKLQTKTCTTFYYRTECQLDEEKKENYNPFLCFFQSWWTWKNKRGDGLRAFVVRFAMVLNSLDSFSVLIKMTNIISFQNICLCCRPQSEAGWKLWILPTGPGTGGDGISSSGNVLQGFDE